MTSNVRPSPLGTPTTASALAYDPRFLGGGAVIPYIGSWTGERLGDATVKRRPEGGIGYTDELLTDRDDRDVLWTRATTAIGVGRPLFTKLHPLRQRRAMRRLLCQVCARPATRSCKGTLWLIPNKEFSTEPGFPEGHATTTPPICLEHVQDSLRLCPGLRVPFVALWARSRVCGVTGVTFRAVGLRGIAFDDEYPDLVEFDAPAIRWTQATSLARELTDVTVVADLDTLS